MKDKTITVTPEIIEAISKIDNRYFFGLFKDIVKNEEEEYELRNALIELNKIIENKWNYQLQNII